MTLQRAAYVTEAQAHHDLDLPPLTQSLEGCEMSLMTWTSLRSASAKRAALSEPCGRDAHLSGAVAAALGEQTGKLSRETTIEKLDVLASKLPA